MPVDDTLSERPCYVVGARPIARTDHSVFLVVLRSNRALSAVFRLLRRSRTAACRQWVKTLDTLFSLLYNLLALMHVGVCLQYFLLVINMKMPVLF